jgi:hypothetical protein
MSEERDQLVKSIYGRHSTYEGLTGWGKAAIDRMLGSAEEETIQSSYQTTLPNLHFSSERRIAQLEAQLQSAIYENHELWLENEELRIQLSEKDEGL